MNRTLSTLAVLATLAGAPALAHEKGGRAMGVIENVTASRIAIKTSDGHVVEFELTPETRFSRGSTTIPAADVRVGARAVVHGARNGDALRAIDVKLAVPAK
jgi:hypothetical protein